MSFSKWFFPVLLFITGYYFYPEKKQMKFSAYTWTKNLWEDLPSSLIKIDSIAPLGHDSVRLQLFYNKDKTADTVLGIFTINCESMEFYRDSINLNDTSTRFYDFRLPDFTKQQHPTLLIELFNSDGIKFQPDSVLLTSTPNIP